MLSSKTVVLLWVITTVIASITIITIIAISTIIAIIIIFFITATSIAIIPFTTVITRHTVMSSYVYYYYHQWAGIRASGAGLSLLRRRVHVLVGCEDVPCHAFFAGSILKSFTKKPPQTQRNYIGALG